ncbi:MAG: hypothetical protein ABSH51_11660 [Solirubrobacteraceae bacterium]
MSRARHVPAPRLALLSLVAVAVLLGASTELNVAVTYATPAR